MALLPDDRVINLASLRIYANGNGLPRPDRRVFNWYAPSAEAWAFGTSTRNSSGIPYLQHIPGLGITNRAFVTPQDTLSANWSTSGGSWEATVPGTGVPRVKRLHQYSTVADTVFSATSSFTHPTNPSFAFTVIFPDSVPDHDASSYPPYARCEFGGGLWAVQIGKSGPAYLLRKVSGSWQAVSELPAPVPLPYSDVQEVLVIVRVQRGALWISGDGGETYTPYTVPGGISVPAGSFTFRGQGGSMSFGLQQVVYSSGVFTSADRTTFGDYSAVTPSIDASYTTPFGTTVNLGNASAAGYARWTATLAPYALSVGAPWSFYAAPELYAVRFRYAGTATTPLGTYSTPFDDQILSARLDKPPDLDGTRLTVEVQLDGTDLVWAPGRYPKVAYYRGWTDCDGVEVWEPSPAFVGYIEPLEFSKEQFNNQRLSFTAVNLSIKFKRAQWTPLDRIPLGGQTVNAALDDVLLSEGLDTSYRSWHAAGDATFIPFGSPENPVEWPRDGESKWETLVRLASYAGCEIGVTDAGVLYTIPRNSTSGNPATQLYVDEGLAPELKYMLQAARLRFDSSDNVTAVFVTGELETGEAGLAVAIDSAAENDPTSARFNNLGRDVELDEVSGGSTVGLLGLRAAALAVDAFRLAFDPDITLPVPNMDINRRDVVYLEGLESIGISPLSTWLVLSLTHELRPMVGESRTTIGLRRLT